MNLSEAILAQVADVQTGPFGSQLHAADYVRVGTPIITVEHIKNNQIGHDDLPLVSHSDSMRLSRYDLRTGDLVFSRVGAVDRCAYVSKKEHGWLFSGRLLRVRPDESLVDAKFLAHLLAHENCKRWILNHAVGSTMACLNTTILGNVPLRLPPRREQRKIAEIVDSVDESIHSTERLIGKRETMLSGLLFDLIDRKVLAHEWDAVTLADLLERPPKNGTSPLESDRFTGTWILGLGCLTKHGFAPRQLKNAPPWRAAMSTAQVYDGELLISRANTRKLVGMVGRYRNVGTRCIYPDLMMKLSPNNRVLPDFLELLLRSDSVRRQIESAASGTSESMVKINAQTVMSLKMNIPGFPEQERIVRSYDVQRLNIAKLSSQLAKLRMVKQGLMEDLLTGRVRVKVD